MATIQNIVDMSEWQALWNGLNAPDAATLCVFKRSPACPISHTAEYAFNRHVASLPENAKVHFTVVDVIAARPVSQRIAADTGVRHESPQLLLLGAGRKIIWTASHDDIDSVSLKEHVGNA